MSMFITEYWCTDCAQEGDGDWATKHRLDTGHYIERDENWNAHNKSTKGELEQSDAVTEK